MKFSVAWLEEWVAKALDIDALSHQLTLAGLEVDKINPLPVTVSKIIVGCVRQIMPHPNADKLRICYVDIGADSLLEIVCGAKNVYVGMYAATALVGSQIGDVEIKCRKLRGVTSEGMLCSASELGIQSVADHEGLLDLGCNQAVGTDCIPYLSLNDKVLELDLTPNRADCFSLLGIARELKALDGETLHEVTQAKVAAQHEHIFPVQIDAPQACPRYLARIVQSLNLDAQTPLWMKERLYRSGIRSIYPIVDVLNYVMLELGQPLHAFDLQKLNDRLIVRYAHQNETLEILDSEQQLLLNEDTLLIADQNKAIAVAGIIGGKHTAVRDTTEDILIECAFFTPEVIAGKARAYGLHTESSRRFERGVDYCLQQRAMERACELLTNICGGEYGLLTEVVDEQYLPQREKITLRHSEIVKRLGISLDHNWIMNTLKHLGIYTKAGKKSWICTPPSHRFDLVFEVDMIEELGRLYGYDNIEDKTPQPGELTTVVPGQSSCRDMLRHQLVSLAYSEVITHSFSDSGLLQALSPVTPLELSNPISPALSAMRTSLWSGLLKTLAYNLNHQQTRLRIFELGNKFLYQNDQYSQPLFLAGLVYGANYPEQWESTLRITDFYDIKAHIDSLFPNQNTNIEYIVEGAHIALHPGKSACILLNGKQLGYLGVLHPGLETVFDVPAGVLLFELDLDKIESKIPRYEPLSPYPSIRRDLSFIVAQTIPVGDLLKCILANKPKVLKNAFLFDLYIGKELGEKQKSVTFGLIFQNFSSTLNDEEIEKCMDSIIMKLKQHYDIEIRS